MQQTSTVRRPHKATRFITAVFNKHALNQYPVQPNQAPLRLQHISPIAVQQCGIIPHPKSLIFSFPCRSLPLFTTIFDKWALNKYPVSKQIKLPSHCHIYRLWLSPRGGEKEICKIDLVFLSNFHPQDDDDYESGIKG